MLFYNSFIISYNHRVTDETDDPNGNDSFTEGQSIRDFESNN